MDPQHRTYPRIGPRHEAGRDITKTAEIIRREIRLEVTTGLLPRGRWTVKSKRHSTSVAIEVTYAPLPTEDELFAIAYYNRERIVFETENPHAHPPMAFRSEFGALLEERIEAKLDEFNCHYTDKSASFFGGFYIHMTTQIAHLKDLHRAGVLEAQPILPPALSYTAMLESWRRERPPTPAEAKVMAEAILGATRHLRLVPPPPPIPAEALETSYGVQMAPGPSELHQLLSANASVRPRAKRRPIAAPVIDTEVAASTESTNEMWLRLAIAEGLKLDWTIPGLGDRR